MRISDWSSDVCSSDLRGARSLTGWGSDRVLGVGPCAPARSGGEAGLGWVTSSDGAVGSGDLEDPGVVHGDVPPAPMDEVVVPGAQEHEVGEIGRASCRERVWQYV